MKVRLFDLLDLNRPLARAARDFDWTEVVNLFPEATNEGMTAARVWVLASMIVLGDVTGLSEGEVISRWPENPYWQAFSGYEHFQWESPVTESDCHSFRRHLDAARSARLAAIAKSIRDAKSIERKLTSPVEAKMDSSGDAALALRKVHFIQPQTVSVYKAPTRPDFHASVKQTYAKAATIIKKVEPAPVQEATSPAPKDDETEQTVQKGTGINDTSKSDTKRGAETKSAGAKADSVKNDTPQTTEEPKKAEVEGTVVDTPEVPTEGESPEPSGIQSQPEPFTQTYSALFRRKPIPASAAPAFAPPPAVQFTPTEAPTTTPQTAYSSVAAAYTPAPMSLFGAPAEPEIVQSPAQIQAMFRTSVAKPKQEIPGTPASPFSVQIQDSAKKQQPVVPAGSPKFDDTTPKVIRAVAGEPVLMEVVVSGDAPLNYQWEQWDDVKGISIPIAGCTEPSLTIALEPDDSMLAFQCRVSNAKAPEGMVSRTFFAKRVTSSQKTPNSFGEKFDPKLFSSGRV